MNKTLTHIERIKMVRSALKLSQTAFGAHLGVSRDVISNIEGNRVTPREHFLKHMYEIYGINEEWFLTGDGEMFVQDERFDVQLEALTILKQLDLPLQQKALQKMKELLELQKE